MLRIFALTLISSFMKAQCGKVYSAVNCSAEFKGGQVKMLRWIEKNTNYFPASRESAVIKYTIDSTGNVCDVTPLKTATELTKSGKYDVTLTPAEIEAVRLFKSMPTWKPARIGDGCKQEVSYQATYKLVFKAKE